MARTGVRAKSGSVAAEQPLGEVHALARMLELELDPVARGPGPYAHLAAERGGEGVLGRAEGILQVRMDHDRAGLAAVQALAVLDLAGAPLSLAYRPSVRSCLARQLEPLRLVLDEQQRASVALRELARLDHRKRLVRQLEQADQVRDRDAAAAHAPGHLLLGQAEVLDQRRAGSRLLDRVEVLAGHVLDQRELESFALVGREHDCGNLAHARDYGRPQPALAGHELVVATGEGAHDDGLEDPARLDRLREGEQRLVVELTTRLIGVRADQLRRVLAQPGLIARVRRENRSEAAAHPARAAAQSVRRRFSHVQPPPWQASDRPPSPSTSDRGG